MWGAAEALTECVLLTMTNALETQEQAELSVGRAQETGDAFLWSLCRCQWCVEMLKGCVEANWLLLDARSLHPETAPRTELLQRLASPYLSCE